MTKLRVLQVAPVPPEVGGTFAGGIATHAWGLAMHLKERGHEVALLSDNSVYGGDWPRVVDQLRVYDSKSFNGGARGVQLRRPSTWTRAHEAHEVLGTIKRRRWVLAKVATFRAVIEAENPDVVHVHALDVRYTLAHAAAPKVPIMVTVHSANFFNFADEALMSARAAVVRANLRSARQITFVSEFVRAQYEEAFPGALDDLTTRVITNPIEAARWPLHDHRAARVALNLPTDGPVALFVGQLIARKAPEEFIDAVAAVRRRGVPLTGLVAGDGEMADELRSRAQALGVGDAVRFDGRRTPEELIDYYAAADVMVLPSRMEGFPLVFLESMLEGCPVVSTSPPLAEALPSAQYGTLVRERGVEPLANAIFDALERDWDRDAIRRHALSYDWPNRIGELEAAYAETAFGLSADSKQPTLAG